MKQQVESLKKKWISAPLNIQAQKKNEEFYF